MMFFKKKPEYPDVEGMSLPELKVEASKISDQILKLSGLNWSLLFCRARIFSATDKKTLKLERQKMKEYISSLSALDQLRKRKNEIAARMTELLGRPAAEVKPIPDRPDMSPKHEPRIVDLKYRVPMSQKLHAGGYI